MAKISGIGTTVTIAGNDLSNDITTFTLDTPYGVQDVTGLDKTGMEKILLRADATGSITWVHNIAASHVHATLKTPGSKTFVIVYPGTATATFTAVTTNYALNMGADGSLTGSCIYQLSSGTPVAWT